MTEKLEVEYINIDDLKPYEFNAKIHTPEQIEQIKESILAFGFNDPVAVWHDNEIIEGHGRLLAAKELNITEIPIIRLDDLTDEERRAYMLVHNKLTMNTGFDTDILELELDKLEEINMGAFGFLSFDKDEVLEEFEAIPDDYEEPEEPPTVQPGDLWALGEHRLVCGDCTDPEAMALLFEDEKAAMVFTDPPYGVAIGDKNQVLKKFRKAGNITSNIEGDTMDAEALKEMLKRAFKLLRTEHAEEYCSYYISAPQGGDVGKAMLEMLEAAGLPVKHTLIWVKNNISFSLGRLAYDYRHEPIYYTWAASHKFYGGYDQTIIDEAGHLEDMTKEELKDLVHALRGDGSTTAIYNDKPMANKLHPTMKPVKLVARFIYNSSKEGDIIADIFGGSGSTLIACEKLKRRCRIAEVDPHYCDVIIQRWEELTGGEAVKIKGGEA